MKHLLTLVLALVCAFALSAHAQSTTLTPNQIGGGSLPNGYDRIAFTLYDGNWTPTVFLPAAPRDKAVVVVRRQSSYGVDLDASRTDLGVPKLSLARDANYTLQFSSATGLWTMSGELVASLTPNAQGATIADNPRPITYYAMWDGNWTASITLPKTAADRSVVVVRSSATWNAQIASANQLFAGTTALRKGDAYTFIYDQSRAAWMLAAAPVRSLGARDIAAGVPRPTSPRTLVEFWDGNWNDTIRLPSTAGDRDRITIRSQATWSSRIDNLNINFPGTMVLARGDEYQFMFIAANGRWELTSSPQTLVQAGSLATTRGALPTLTRPRTLVQCGDGNTVSTVILPTGHRPGDRVIVRNTAPSITVNAGGQSVPVGAGEIVSFVAGMDNAWQKETRTIDLLMLYSDKAAAKFGENTMRARLVEGLGMTNDALENSRANFRFRVVGTRQVTAYATWTDLGHPLRDLRADATVQGWRSQLHADGLYYEGTEDGCGLAWVNSTPSDYNMVASGSTNCGTNVMRHELGHNMGLNHSMGYALAGTIMAGNAMPFFAAPYLYSEDGLPLTPAGGWNEVGGMNGRSSAVAAFR